MSVFHSNALIGASGQAGGGPGPGPGPYSIERSVRFDSSSSAYLNRTPSSAGNRKTWTWSGWVKRSGLSTSAQQRLFETSIDASNQATIKFLSNDFQLYDRIGGTVNVNLITTALYRDPSAWYHFLVAVDTTQSTASDRVKVYVNGSQVTDFSTSTYPAQNHDFLINTTNQHDIGRYGASNSQYLDGYLADVHFIDGQALAPTDFGEFDATTGVWNPIQYTGGFGLVSVANATGALPIYNTTDTYGTTKGTGTRTDSNSSSIVLAVAMDGTNGGTTFTDESAAIKGSGSAKSITRNNTTTSTSQSFYYGSSGSFNGSNTNLQVTSTLSDFAFSGNFTIECWLYLNSGATNDRYLLDYRSSGPTGQNTYIYFNSGGNGGFRFNMGGAGEAASANGAVSKGAWHHFALVRSGSTITAYINGVSTVTQTNSSSISAPGQSLKIGSAWTNTTQPWDGYISDFRVYNGVAKYTSNFTPVNSYSNSFHLDFEDNSTAAALGNDVSGNNNDWTVNNIVANSLYSNAGFLNPANAFDGNTSTYAEVNATGALGSFIFTSGVSVTSSVTVKYASGTSGNIFLNGSATAMQGTGTQTQTISFSGTLETLGIQSGSGPQVYYVQVDGGSYLTGENSVNTDSLFDSPSNGTQTDTGAGGEVTGNHCVLNPLDISIPANFVLSNGNLQAAAGNGICRGTIAVPSSGKWYYESTYLSTDTSNGWGGLIGIQTADDSKRVVFFSNSVASAENGIYKNASLVQTITGASSVGDVLGVRVDADASTIQFYRNGSALGTAVTYDAGTYFFAFGGNGSSYNSLISHALNFGQRPFAYSSNATGCKALCTANLPTPTIEDGSTAMDIALYTGNGSTQTISGLGFSPDLVWVKSRNQAAWWHVLTDSVRGGGYYLHSNNTNAEGGGGTSLITGFTSDGFALNNSPNGTVNALSDTYVAWTWDGGSSTVTNTDGSITSSVRANPSAGFSIVSYSGVDTPSTNTVGHGLGVAPSLWIIKNRTNASPQGWVVNFTFLDGSVDYMFLNLTNAKANQGSPWSTLPTSTVFTLGANDGNTCDAGADYIAYCFAPVEGYSAFGSYTGNGSTDGTFVYTGFRPRWVVIKRTDTSENWVIQDTERSVSNIATEYLLANTSSAEGNSDIMDMLSNGFKQRNTFASNNASGGTYVWAAFAENPFRYARAR